MRCDTDDDVSRAYEKLVQKFELLKSCAGIWDVTADRQIDRAAERSVAHRGLDRKRISIDFASSDLIRFDGRAMRFGNANGVEMLVYPAVIMMPRADGHFALLDLREVDIDFNSVRFIEEGEIPHDTPVVGHAWAKANKDGSRDRRFSDNYQIPICEYGHLLFSTSTGLTEEYQFSNWQAASNFAHAFAAYKAALSRLAASGLG